MPVLFYFFPSLTNTITLPLGVKVLDAYAPQEGEVPEIIAGSINHYLYAHRRGGTLLWEYETHDHIRAVSIKDIDGDGKVEVVVGSESLVFDADETRASQQRPRTPAW